MKKKLLITGCLIFGIFSVNALTKSFSIDSSKLSLVTNAKNDSLIENFDNKYLLSHSISSSNKLFEEEITDLTKKVTYLLLGSTNNKSESNDNYYKRHQEYLDMGAYNTFPKDKNSNYGFDENVPNYLYAYISQFAVPSMFNQVNELGIVYNSYSDIRITINDNLVISSILLPNVTMKQENEINKMEYDIIKTDLLFTYYFIKIDNEYKLCYLFGETKEEFQDYFTEVENEENKNSMNLVSSYDSNLKDIYDFSKLDKVDDVTINNIYELNKDNIVTLDSYYNNYSVASSNGFFINDGIIITTWNFLEKSLVEAQYITIKDRNGIIYLMDGIITVNPETDIAVIKLKENVNKKIKLGNSKEMRVEDPIFTLSSKTGVGLTMQKGIILSTSGYIQSAIPLTISDEGSPLLDINGNVVGINTSKQVNSSISLAINSDVLQEVQYKFDNVEFNSIDVITFEELKEKYYYVKYSDELIKNNIPNNKWKKFSKVGNIEENIKLELVKANYKNNVISLRYQNNISDYVSGMQLAVSFKEQLINDGYKELVNGTKKCIYQNDEYKVIIMDEFNYLIVVMVKL